MEKIEAYRKAFGTMDKIKQVIMLYETAIASLSQAKEHIAEKDFQECYNKTEKAYLIVSGLRDCIDMDNGGEVAKTLVDWYSEVSLRIITVNRSQDVELCDLCIKNLNEMRAAWVEAEQISNQEAQEEAGASDSKDEENFDSNEKVVISESSDSNPLSENGGSVYSQSLLQGLSLSI